MLPLRAQYDWLRAEYAGLRDANNPPKASIQLAYDDTGESPTSFVNVLASRISNGYYGTKTIMCDMATGRTVSQTTLFSPDNKIVGVIDSARLTTRRCALMAVIAAENYFGTEGLREAQVGLIGAGAINLKTAAALHDLFGVKHFVYKTPSGKLRTDLSDMTDKLEFHPARKFSDLAFCDAIFVATTETAKENQASAADFEFNSSRVLMVTQDTGCLLDESFRLTFPSFTDSVEQIKGHWKDCFPWDRFGPCDLRPLSRLAGHHGPAAVYLYGMGFSDIVMACAELGIKR